MATFVVGFCVAFFFVCVCVFLCLLLWGAALCVCSPPLAFAVFCRCLPGCSNRVWAHQREYLVRSGVCQCCLFPNWLGGLSRFCFAPGVAHAEMRVLCGCVLALTLAGSAEGLTSMRHHSHSHSHSHSRLHSHIVSHDTVSADSAPCGAGYVRVFQPQLGCAHLSAPKEVVDLVVVTESTCKDVLQGIRTKTAPYWDLEMNRCADESRKGLLTQCATKIGSNFSTSLQVCAKTQYYPPPLPGVPRSMCQHLARGAVFLLSSNAH